MAHGLERSELSWQSPNRWWMQLLDPAPGSANG
jgi:hypothetical protein